MAPRKLFVVQHSRFIVRVLVAVLSVLLGVFSLAQAQPDKGPPAQPYKTIVFVASNLRNDGVKEVSESFQHAAKQLKWNVKIVNCAGKKSAVKDALVKAVNDSPDGVVLGGFDGSDYRDLLKKAHKKNIKIVGWHAASKSGPGDDMFINVSTDPTEVAKAAAEQLRNYGTKPGGVIILTDRDYSIATAKTLAMKRAIEQMDDFKLIAVEDLPISAADKEIDHLVKAWNQRYGKSWTHTLAINDLYFDHMAASLKSVHREDIVGIGAGDGSKAAISRVGAVKTPQLVTIAEPLKSQGWQLADELNRSFAGDAPSNFKTQLIVISKNYLDGLKHGDIEEGIFDQESYLKIWYPDRKKETTSP